MGIYFPKSILVARKKKKHNNAEGHRPSSLTSLVLRFAYATNPTSKDFLNRILCLTHYAFPMTKNTSKLLVGYVLGVKLAGGGSSRHGCGMQPHEPDEPQPASGQPLRYGSTRTKIRLLLLL